MTPGDRVVCVTLTAPCCDNEVGNDIYPPPVVGRAYIVGIAGTGMCCHCLASVMLVVMRGHEHGQFGWPQVLFAPIQHAEQSFTQLMRRMRPAPARTKETVT